MKAAEHHQISTRTMRLGADKNGVLVLNLRQPSRRHPAESQSHGRMGNLLDRLLDFLFAP